MQRVWEPRQYRETGSLPAFATGQSVPATRAYTSRYRTTTAACIESGWISQ